MVAWTYYIIRDVVCRTLARKFKIRTRAQVYKKFGHDLSIYDKENRYKGRPKLVAELIRPDYHMNV